MATGWSPEGRQLLVVLLVLAGVLVTLERCCAWRLGVARRQAMVRQSGATSILLVLPSAPPASPSTVA